MDHDHPHPKFPEEETYSSAQRLWADAILSGVLCTRDRKRTLVRAHSAASCITIIHTLSFRRRKLTHQHSVCGQTQSCRECSARGIGREPWFERKAPASWITIIHTLSFRRRKLTHQHSACGQTQSCRECSAREIGREPWFERTAQHHGSRSSTP